MVVLTCDFDEGGVVEIRIFKKKVGQIYRRTNITGDDWYEVYFVPPEYPKVDRSLIAKADSAYECFFKFIKWYEFTFIVQHQPKAKKEAESCTA